MKSTKIINKKYGNNDLMVIEEVDSAKLSQLSSKLNSKTNLTVKQKQLFENLFSQVSSILEENERLVYSMKR